MNASNLQKIDRRYLYVILMIAIIASFFVPQREIANQPDENVKDAFVELMTAPTDRPVFIQTDWTNSTRGESRGHFLALMRILMARDMKFVFYSVADVQAPAVARKAIQELNEERKAAGLREYKPWVDYLDLGFFPNAENVLNAFAADLRGAWSARRAPDETGRMRDVFQSPVLAGVRKVEDSSLYIVVSASNSVDVAFQRLASRTRMTALVTGVMGPGVLPYWRSGQIKGLAVGLKGVYDMEYTMKNGLNYVAAGKTEPAVPYMKDQKLVIEPLPGTTFDQGARYFFALHVTLFLMILAIVLGNIGMYLDRKKKKVNA